MCHGFHKNNSSTLIGIFIDVSLVYQNYFLKNHVALKTGVMAAVNSAVHHRNKLHFNTTLTLINIKITNYSNNISQYYCF